MIVLQSCLAAIWLNLASLKSRIWPALVVVIGVACVVGVLLSMLSMTMGLRQSWLRAGRPDRGVDPVSARPGDRAAVGQVEEDPAAVARAGRAR